MMEIINNTVNEQFEVRQEGHLAVMQYRVRRGRMYFMHTGVPQALSGRGIAAALDRRALAPAREQAYTIVVYCPFVAAFLKRHPEYDDLIDGEYSKNKRI